MSPSTMKLTIPTLECILSGSPAISPDGQEHERRYGHGLADGHRGLQPQRAAHEAQQVAQQRQRREHGRRARQPEDVLAFVVGAQLLELLFQFLLIPGEQRFKSNNSYLAAFQQ